MGGYAEPEWHCGECGHSFNPLECKLIWNIKEETGQISIIIYCPNRDCAVPWIDVCCELRGGD